MKIKDLKEPYRSIAKFDCKNQGNESRIYKSIVAALIWDETKAGKEFYENLYKGKYPLITEQIKLDYPEVFTNKEESLKMETEKEFKFKVGDKIKSKGWKDVVEIISLKGENEHNFTGIDSNNKVDGTYIKSALWELYKEPKEKIKLQKFYYKICGGWEFIYAESKEKVDLLELITEQEFLEKFEI